MRTKLSLLALSSALLLVISLAGHDAAPRAARAESGAAEIGAISSTVSLAPVWSTGIISDDVGQAGLVVADIDDDGDIEVASCAAGSAFVIRPIGALYASEWHSQRYPCARIAAGDANGDGRPELFVAVDDTGGGQGAVHRFNTVNYALEATLVLPDNATINDLLVEDVNDDTQSEVVVVVAGETRIYNAQTFGHLWTAAGNGGDSAAAGDVDDDNRTEIVVNGPTAYVLDANGLVLEKSYAGGFGDAHDVGDVDGDGVDEIAYITAAGVIAVFEADLDATKWSLSGQGSLSAVALDNINVDPKPELLVGNTGAVRAYISESGAFIADIANPYSGVAALAGADVDADGATEIVWAGGLIGGSLVGSGPQGLFVGHWQTESIEWSGGDLDGPLYTDAGDVDADGQVEIVVLSHTTDNGFDGATLKVFDANSRVLEWSILTSASLYDGDGLVVAQLDGDPALEIAVAAEVAFDTQLRIYDGQTKLVEWESGDLAPGPPRALIAANVIGDANEELIVGLDNGRIQVYNDVPGPIYSLAWESGTIAGTIVDISAGHLDNNASVDVAVLTTQRFVTYNSATWLTLVNEPFSNGRQVVISNEDTSGGGELVFAVDGGLGGSQLLGYGGVPVFGQLWSYDLAGATVNEILVDDMDGDLEQEIVVLGATAAGMGESLLLVGTQPDKSMFAEETALKGHWGTLFSGVVIDVSGDGSIELIFSSDTLVQVDDVAYDTPEFILFSPYFVHPFRGWMTMVDEDFEGAFPADWMVLDTNPGSGEHYWGKRNCRAFSGDSSGWAVGGGAEGSTLSCGAIYPGEVAAAMIYGPINLASARLATLDYQVWLNLVPDISQHRFCQLASNDGLNFYGDCATGGAATWQPMGMDLANVTGFGSMLGQGEVWIGFLFVNDSTTGILEGVYVDDILVEQCLGGFCPFDGPQPPPFKGEPIELQLNELFPDAP